MLPVAAVFSALGKKDWLYLAVILALLVSLLVGRSYYVSLIAEATQAKAECLIEQTNLSNKLSTEVRKLEIAEGNYQQCKASRAGLDAWIADYQKGCAESKTVCEDQLKACINGKPAVPVNTKEGVRGISHEEGKESAQRIRNRLTGVSSGGMSSTAP